MSSLVCGAGGWRMRKSTTGYGRRWRWWICRALRTACPRSFRAGCASAWGSRARFRTVGGLGVGSPVVLRGVRVGRVEAIRLAPGNWVEADLKIYAGVRPPDKPAVIAASASLFGEWAATLIPSEPPPADPNVRQALRSEEHTS